MSESAYSSSTPTALPKEAAVRHAPCSSSNRIIIYRPELARNHHRGLGNRPGGPGELPSDLGNWLIGEFEPYASGEPALGTAHCAIWSADLRAQSNLLFRWRMRKKVYVFLPYHCRTRIPVRHCPTYVCRRARDAYAKTRPQVHGAISC